MAAIGSHLPQFSKIDPAQIKQQVIDAIEHCKSVIEQQVKLENAGYHQLLDAIDEADDGLSKLWSPISHLNSVLSSEALRQAHDDCLPLLSDYSTFVGQHQGLYQAYKAIANSAEFSQLDIAKQTTVTNALRDFELSGIGLQDQQKQQYKKLVSRLSELSSQFSNNLLDATQAWIKQVTEPTELKGLPESAVAAAKQQADARELEGWVFTLEFPSYLPVMMYADSSAFREEMYRAFVTRASDQGPNAGEFDNSAIIDETLKLKLELSKLLGFDNYAQKSLATKMAETPAQVFEFIDSLAQRSKPQAEKEISELKAFASEQGFTGELQPWDYSYFAEKLKQHKYEISQEELRPYFPEEKVLHGLFYTVSRLFGIKIQERKGMDVWHDDVRFFDIFNQIGELKGSFYLDLYARSNKRGGAWMDVCRDRRLSDGKLQRPVAYLTCNFNGPVGDKPALFTHEEVTTLFHEFGHGIHHMLSEVNEAAVSGINGVAWDAVELPSQFLENWCYEEEALAEISGHYQTGEPLPKAMLDKMLAAKNFQSAMQMLRQLEFAQFDFKLHHDYQDGLNVQQLLDEVRSQIAVITPPSFNRFQHSFSHIFAGGYAAGYYSYKWAEVLSADAFSKFEQEGIFNEATGYAFLSNILQKGGSEPAMELFKGFMGREPNTDALLRHSGIA
ncbi:oligopeptidase A [Paraferrimonas sp. SM1919]|uniref:oligopeptidase A n=1 Tax=Paraferrimonas sp. SM1919 TaxID=2662263 RepID=UPI0013D3DFA0|nr:oligopeptidase A [Paraferrimonas sp. SM1919]